MNLWAAAFFLSGWDCSGCSLFVFGLGSIHSSLLYLRVSNIPGSYSSLSLLRVSSVISLISSTFLTGLSCKGP